MPKYVRYVAKNKLSTSVKSAVGIYVSNALNLTSYFVSNVMGKLKNLLDHPVELKK